MRMWTQLIAGKTISAVNFAIHALITALIVFSHTPYRPGANGPRDNYRAHSFLQRAVKRLRALAVVASLRIRASGPDQNAP